VVATLVVGLVVVVVVGVVVVDVTRVVGWVVVAVVGLVVVVVIRVVARVVVLVVVVVTPVQSSLSQVHLLGQRCSSVPNGRNRNQTDSVLKQHTASSLAYYNFPFTMQKKQEVKTLLQRVS
jgi:hypothetical protein